MFASETTGFFAYFTRAYPKRTLLMVLLLIGSGLAEGIGLITLLPVLEFAVTSSSGAQQSDLTRSVVEVLETLGIPPGLGPLLVVIVLAIIAKALFRLLANKQVGYTVAQVATDLRLRLIRALLDAKWSFFTAKPTGHFANAISSEAGRASIAYQAACLSLADFIQVVVYLGVAFAISWEVTVVTLLVAPMLVWALKAFVQLSRRAGEEQTSMMKELIARITALLPGIKAVKAMSRERHLLPLLEKETEGFNDAQQKSVLATTSLKAFQEPLIVLVLAIGLYAALTLGTASGSAVLVSAVLFYRVMTTASNLQNNYQRITVNESAFWSLLETIEEAEGAAEDRGDKGRPPPEKLAKGIRLEDVSFAYEKEAVLRSVNLEIPSGSIVSLIGASGAGKTTLVDIICGLLLPHEGHVLVDDVPLSKLDLPAWRRKIGYVPQEVLLYHDSVFQNVTLGDEAFDREDVENALRAAGAWQFIQQLPGGMDYQIGERGVQISGGQRQRIAIARAMVSKPELLIFDEATTALDPETEQQICETLIELRGRTTIISVSHQPAIREVSDRVYRMSGGTVSLLSPEREISPEWMAG